LITVYGFGLRILTPMMYYIGNHVRYPITHT